MDKHAETASKAVDRTETDLLHSVALRDLSYAGLELQLAKFRDACADFIFVDWHSASLKNVETRLWQAHGRVNQKFRGFIARFRDSDGKKKHVERRKAEKLYLDFIKSSMRFYRGFVQRLASHFADVPELFEIAHMFSLDTLSADTPVPADATMKRNILQSCHATLIRLGDLSRYRETELNQKQRNWGPAKGYYDLANHLDPTDGMAYNQLAVIALADNDHLRAVYYLYRAICTPTAPPTAVGNLEVEFKKVLKHHKRGDSLLPAEVDGEAGDLTASFLAYHAACYLSTETMNHKVKQRALTNDISKQMRSRPLESVVRKFCVINIAANHQAQVRCAEALQSSPGKTEKLASFLENSQGLNIATFTALLKILVKELQLCEAAPKDYSTVIRNVLPLARLYSGWLVSKVSMLLASQSSGTISDSLPEFWTTYAEALTCLTTMYMRDGGTDQCPYLLDEDQDMVTFTAFSPEVRKLHFEHATGLKLDRIVSDLSRLETSDTETLWRIQDFVKVGAHLSRHRDEYGDTFVPLQFAGMQFHYTGGTEPPIASMEISGVSIGELINPYLGDSSAESSAMESMVNDLVETKPKSPQRSSASEHRRLHTPGTSGTRPSSSHVTAQDLVRQIQQPSPSAPQANNVVPSHRLSLPSIIPSPFTPRPGENLGSGSRPGTSHQAIPPSTAPVPPSREAFEFQQQIAHMKANIANRTSPVIPFDPTQSSNFETPSGLHTFLRNQMDQSPSDSPIKYSSAPSAHIVRKPQGSPFGAIGEARPKSAKTPTSGQAG